MTFPIILSPGVAVMARRRYSPGWIHRFRRRFSIDPLEPRITLSDSGLPYDIGAAVIQRRVGRSRTR